MASMLYTKSSAAAQPGLAERRSSHSRASAGPQSSWQLVETHDTCSRTCHRPGSRARADRSDLARHRIVVAFQPSRHQASSGRRDYPRPEHSQGDSYRQQSQRGRYSSDREDHASSRSSYGRQSPPYRDREDGWSERDRYRPGHQSPPPREQETGWSERDRYRPDTPSSQPAQLPPGYGFNPMGAPGNGRETARREQVKACIARNAALGKMQQDACAAAFGEGFLSNQQQTSVLRTFVSMMQEMVREEGRAFDRVNVSTAVHHLGAVLHHEAAHPAIVAAVDCSQLVEDLASLVYQHAPTFKIVDIHMSLWGFAKLQVPVPEDVMRDLALRAMHRFSELPLVEVHHLANLMWAIAKLGANPLDGALFQECIRQILPRLNKCNPQNLSNFVWAVVERGLPLPEGAWDKVAQQAVLLMPSANAQSVAVLCRGVGRQGLDPLQGDFFRTALRRCGELRQDGARIQAQHIANILWAVAASRHPISGRSLDMLAAGLLERRQELMRGKASTISAVMYSCGRLGRDPVVQVPGRTGASSLVQELLGMALERLQDMDAQPLANMLWALGQLQVHLPPAMLQALGSHFADHLLQQLGNVPARHGQHLANSLWGYAQLRINPQQGRWLASVLEKLEQQPPQTHSLLHLGSIVLSAAALGQALPQRLVDGILHRFCTHAQPSDHRQIACLVYALAAVGQLQAGPLASLLEPLAGLDPLELPNEELHQLHMADLAVKAAQGLPLSSPSLLPEPLQAPAAAATVDSQSSAFHQQVCSVLRGIGIAHQQEVATPDGLFCLDIVAQVDGSPVVVEVDGPAHFLATPPYQPCGKTLLRNRLLAAGGHMGVAVPFYHWDQLDSLAARGAYLRQRLGATLVRQQQVAAAMPEAS